MSDMFQHVWHVSTIVKGYLGFEKVISRPVEEFYMAVYASRCQGVCALVYSCQRNKPRNQFPTKPLEVPTRRLEEVTLDFVMELPCTSSGSDAIVVTVDILSKIVRFCPTTSDMDAVGSVKLFFNHWYRHDGLPRKVLSDRDGYFVGKFGKSYSG
jgi:hypothetical protein